MCSAVSSRLSTQSQARVAAADDHDALVDELVLVADEVVDALALPRLHVDVGDRQLLGLERAVAAGDDHRARAQLLAVGGVQHDDAVVALALVGDRLGGRLEVDRHVERLDLLAQLRDEVLGQHLRVAGDVEDPLLRIQRRQLAADLGQRVDDARGRLAHARPEGGAQAHGARADDRDVADVGIGFDAHVREMVSASPSSALTRALQRGVDAGEARRVALGEG